MIAATYIQATLFGAFADCPAHCVRGPALRTLRRGRVVPPPASEESLMEFVVDSEAEPGNVLPAIAELLIELARRP